MLVKVILHYLLVHRVVDDKKCEEGKRVAAEGRRGRRARQIYRIIIPHFVPSPPHPLDPPSCLFCGPDASVKAPHPSLIPGTNKAQLASGFCEA